MISKWPTIFEFRRHLAEEFSASGLDEVEALARGLLCDVLDCSFTDLLLANRQTLNEAQLAVLRADTERLKQGEPLQYVTGRAHFGGQIFVVDRRVLIPRPETEELVMWVHETLDAKSSVLDVGTGSGCIAITLKIRQIQLDVVAVDVSPDALEVAKKNAENLGADVHFVQCDILASTPPGHFDAVVSNPPYVRELEKSSMTRQVLDYEPSSALFVPDNDPLIFYRAIAQKCQNGLLKPGGWLFFEINEALGDEVLQLLDNEGFTHIELRQDIYGRDRMVRARRNV